MVRFDRHAGLVLLLLSSVQLLLCCWCHNISQVRLEHSELSVKTVLDNLIPPTVVTADACPGVVGATCTRQCQLRICESLADLYRASNNVSDPWDDDHGWDLTTTQSCRQLMAQSPPGAPPVYCSWHGVRCCEQADTTEQRCYLLDSVSALNLAINNLNVSLENPVFFRSVKTLHDCGMFILNMESNNIIGRITEDWGQLPHLRYLNLGTLWLHGSIPQAIRKMHNLTVLNLGNNWFHGTLPSFLADLPLLRVLNLGSQFGGNEGSDLLGLVGSIPAGMKQLGYLRELVLEANSLSGQLPKGLCHNGSGSLLVLNVRGNRLEGSAKEVEDCNSLVQLDISHNSFTGSLPASPHWEQLASYRADYNQFTGTWPSKLSETRILEHLDVSHNALSGFLPPKVTLMSSLKSLKLSHNRLSGTVPEDVYFLPALAVLDLSSNLFVGTTPASIGLAYSLTELDLSNNTGITGFLPPQMGLVPRLQELKITNTNMSCAGIIKAYTVTTNFSCTDPDVCTTPQKFGDEAAPVPHCGPDELLPCFLRFSSEPLPREDNSNMKCKVIMRKPIQQAQQDCSGSGPQQLGAQADSLPETATDRWSARWEIDPAYYQYQACECLLGWAPRWDDTGTVLSCVPELKSTQHRSIIIAVVVASAAVLLVAFLVWRQYLKTRPRWLRERTLQAKRSKGAPKATKPGDKVLVSILVTDVKDFSALTLKHPELMNKAMGGHNNIMRKACHAHAGHVLDQEGDSWTVAFHDAEDAVAFSLQVQQALGDKVWEHRHLASSEDSIRQHAGSHTAQTSDISASSSYAMLGLGTASPLLSMVTAAGGSQTDTQPQASGCLHGSFSAASDDPGDHGSSCGRGSSSLGYRSRDCSFTSPPGQVLLRGDVELGELPASTSANGNTTQAQSTGLCSQGQGPAGLQQQRKTPQQQLRSRLDPDADDVLLGHHDTQQHWQQQQQRWGARKLNQSFRQAARPEASPSAAAAAAQTQEGHRLQLGSWIAETGSGVSQHSGTVSTVQSSRPSSRLYSAGSALMHRLSRAVRSNFSSALLQPAGSDHGIQELRLSVRIGIATGWLTYGTTLDNSKIKERAKSYVSDVANGGQILIDSRTFRLIKHSLSALGTVDENGYNDKQLQQMLQARVVARLQRHVACGAGCCSAGANDSFSSHSTEELPRDYDTDAIVVHMGGFTAPLPAPQSAARAGLTTTSDDSTASAEDDSCDGLAAMAAAAAGADKGPGHGKRGRRKSLQGRGEGAKMHLQLYSIAAPKMRQLPQTTNQLQSCTAWMLPVRVKPGWVQVQKDYFQAPGARPEDLVPTSQQDPSSCRPPLPPVTFVFAEVLSAHSFNHKHNKSELQAANRAIRRCMKQLMADLPGGDGYMCRCHEPDLKYMVVFESPVRAVQWCLLLQEALMYMDWPEHILGLPGFEEVLDPLSGQLLFRGPRLRMGMSEGLPSNVLPDHMGHANYAGGAVNRAARFMDAAAHPGQIVCDLQFAQRCFETWAQAVPAGQSGRQSWGSALDATSPVSIPESAAATDWGDPQVSLMQLMALRSQSETSGHCRPATGLQGLRSRALHELWFQQQQLKQQQKDVYARQARLQQQQYLVQEQPQLGLRAAGLEAGSSSSACPPLPRSMSVRPPGSGGYMNYGSSAGLPRPSMQPFGASLARFNPLTVGPGGSSILGHAGRQPAEASIAAMSGMSEPVTASFIGTFSFKGSGVYDMVQLQHSVLLGRQFPHAAPKGKGMRLAVASGPATGLPQVQLQIPARVLAGREAYSMRAATWVSPEDVDAD